MKQDEYKRLDPLADSLAEEGNSWLQSPGMAEFRQALQDAVARLPSNYSVEIAIELRAFDVDREKSLRLLSTGLNVQPGHEPYEVSGDSSPHRYIVDGEICEVPHDYCPHCWGDWDFKLSQPICPECGYGLGKQVKLLLDSDACPNCEVGRISLTESTCRKCGFRVDPTMITWG